ncbi:hypothetical protein EC844_1424 [Acinetobacter calcoaceticus]|uniref:DUF4199 domain-containing protein n=1 Tax=Acinetobacter calcoaceticus TaxID=471 RepID=A0A4R1X7Q1_ACICA|nr:hypothetical protein EC844_1424 [Acinetobacter calcoaceticus]
MKKISSSNDSESTVLGWKFLAIVGTLTSIFFTFLYLAMSNPPDYMPNRKPKAVIQQTTPIDAAQQSEKTLSDQHTSSNPSG